MPSIADYLRENFTPDSEFKPETAEADMQKLTAEVNQLKANLDKMMQDGKTDYNTTKTAILNFLNKQTQLSYLKLTSMIKIPEATTPNPAETPNNQQQNPT